MKNAKKNADTVIGTPFTSDRQPSPEAKSKGWERRREAQKILNEIMMQGDLTYAEMKEKLADIKRNPDKHTLREVKIANYLMSTKSTIDWLDRHVSKAPHEIDMVNGIEIKFTREEMDNEETDRPKV